VGDNPRSEDYDPTQIERLGWIESTNHRKYIAVEPIAPLSKYATDWVRPENILCPVGNREADEAAADQARKIGFTEEMIEKYIAPTK
jgi:hypothetical protein